MRPQVIGAHDRGTARAYTAALNGNAAAFVAGIDDELTIALRIHTCALWRAGLRRLKKRPKPRGQEDVRRNVQDHTHFHTPSVVGSVGDKG